MYIKIALTFNHQTLGKRNNFVELSYTLFTNINQEVVKRYEIAWLRSSVIPKKRHNLPSGKLALYFLC